MSAKNNPNSDEEIKALVGAFSELVQGLAGENSPHSIHKQPVIDPNPKPPIVEALSPDETDIIQQNIKGSLDGDAFVVTIKDTETPFKHSDSQELRESPRETTQQRHSFLDKLEEKNERLGEGYLGDQIGKSETNTTKNSSITEGLSGTSGTCHSQSGTHEFGAYSKNTNLQLEKSEWPTHEFGAYAKNSELVPVNQTINPPAGPGNLNAEEVAKSSELAGNINDILTGC